MTEEPEVNEIHALIAAYIRNHPDDSFQTIAARLQVAVSTISRIARANGLSRNNNITINPEILNEEL
jgi:DNA-binding MurR/RpiR family transcriptional regulator